MWLAVVPYLVVIMLEGIDKKSGCDSVSHPLGVSFGWSCNLLVQLLFDRFFSVLGTQGTPEAIRTLASRATFPATTISVVATVSNVILVAGFYRVSNEDYCTVSHQDVGSTLVVAGGTKSSSLAVPALNVVAVGR